MSWRRLEDVLKMSWKRLEDVLKTSWKRLEDDLKTYDQDEYVRLDEDVFVFWRRMSKANILVLIKTSWRRLLKTKTKDVFKTLLSRQMFAGYITKIGIWHYYYVVTTLLLNIIFDFFIVTKYCHGRLFVVTVATLLRVVFTTSFCKTWSHSKLIITGT